MMYDLGFLSHQFIGDLPSTFVQWVAQIQQHFPSLFDTKVLSQECGNFGKTELKYLYQKCLTDKKFSNSLVFKFEQSNPDFLKYETSQQSHDAGYDAYMTGVVFATLSKFIEIG